MKAVVRAVVVRPGFMIVRGSKVMAEEISIRCRVCDTPLESERELDIQICLERRRYGLLTGCWPDANELPNSSESVTTTHHAIRIE